MFCCKISETSQFFPAVHVLEYEVLAKGKANSCSLFYVKIV